MQKPKRQRKAKPNAMVQRSINKGSNHIIAGTAYKGRPKIIDQYGRVIQRGLPFVRV